VQLGAHLQARAQLQRRHLLQATAGLGARHPPGAVEAVLVLGCRTPGQVSAAGPPRSRACAACAARPARAPAGASLAQQASAFLRSMAPRWRRGGAGAASKSAGRRSAARCQRRHTRASRPGTRRAPAAFVRRAVTRGRPARGRGAERSRGSRTRTLAPGRHAALRCAACHARAHAALRPRAPAGKALRLAARGRAHRVSASAAAAQVSWDRWAKLVGTRAWRRTFAQRRHACGCPATRRWPARRRALTHADKHAGARMGANSGTEVADVAVACRCCARDTR
jgi:hypothetical protein